MIAVLVLAMATLVILVVGELVLDFSSTLELAVVLSLIVLTGLGVLIQFSQRCPNCGHRLGFQSRLLVLDTCKKCGLHLKAVTFHNTGREGVRGLEAAPRELPDALG